MKTVVITVSSRSLGFEMAQRFRKNGCNVVKAADIQNIIDRAVEQFGCIDIRMNNTAFNKREANKTPSAGSRGSFHYFTAFSTR